MSHPHGQPSEGLCGGPPTANQPCALTHRLTGNSADAYAWAERRRRCLERACLIAIWHDDPHCPAITIAKELCAPKSYWSCVTQRSRTIPAIRIFLLRDMRVRNDWLNSFRIGSGRRTTFLLRRSLNTVHAPAKRWRRWLSRLERKCSRRTKMRGLQR